MTTSISIYQAKKMLATKKSCMEIQSGRIKERLLNTKIIKNYGTNFEFIINFIFDSHNYEKQHENILALSEIHPTANEDFSAFYNKFRRSVCSNLKKMGTKIKFLGNFELLEDEILSPTFEEVILLWCLEKIDPRQGLGISVLAKIFS